MSYIKQIDNEYWISATALKETSGVPDGTLKAIRSRWNKERKSGKYTELNKEYWYCYNNLPVGTYKKVNIQNLLNLEYSTNSNKEVQALKRLIEIQIRNYQNYYNTVRHVYCLKVTDCTDFAQKWAVWDWMIADYCQRSKTNFKQLHEAYIQLFPKHLNNYKSFIKFKNDCLNNGVENMVIDRRKFGIATRQLSDSQYYFIRERFMNDRKFTSTQIHKMLTAFCLEIEEDPCSVSTVKHYMYNCFEKDAECRVSRYGVDVTSGTLPTYSTIPALHKFDQVQGDGWTLPLFTEVTDKHGNDKTVRMVLFAFLDAHSRKIIGYSIGIRENTELIKEALEDLLYKTSILPAEFVFDKHSAQGSGDLKTFREQTEQRGVIHTISSNPRRKAILERYHQYLDGIIQVNYKGWIGKGVKSKSKNSLRNPETYSELLKRENLYSIEETKAIIADVILEYNKTPRTALNGKSPNEAFEQSEAKHGIQVTKGEAIELLKPKKPYKVTGAQITIRVGIIKHEFQLPASLHYLEGETVQVVYEDLRDGIYIEDEKSGLFTEIKPKQKIHGALVNRTEEDERILNNTTGRTNGVKVQSNTGRKVKKSLLLNSPDTLDYLSHHNADKDIRKTLEENKLLSQEVANMGVRLDRMPKRNTRNIERKRALGKSERHPFHTKDHKISKINPGDFKDTFEE